MVEDLELGVQINTDQAQKQLEDDLEDANISAGLTGGPDDGGGTLDAGERQQQEGLIAGGVSKGLLAAGVFGGILSQLGSVQGILSGIAGSISRALLPAVEVIADLLRPLISGINSFISDPSGTVEQATGVSFQQLRPGLRATGITAASEAVQGDFGGAGRELFEGSVLGQSAGFVGGLVENLFGDKNADESSEAQKQQLKELANDPFLEKLGNLQG